MRWLVLRKRADDGAFEVERFATQHGAMAYVTDCVEGGSRDHFEVYERGDRIDSTAQLLEAVDALLVDVDSLRGRLAAIQRARAIYSAEDGS
jgi:hypothetical protein